MVHSFVCKMYISQNLFYLFFALIRFYQERFREIYAFLRNAFNNFIEDKNDFNKAFVCLQSFAKISLILIARDVLEYLTRSLSRSRIFWVFLIRIVVIIHTLRFGVSALLCKQSVREFLFDFGFMIGPPRLISSAITAVSLAIVAIGLTTQYFEIGNQLVIYDIGHMISTKQIKYPLNYNNGRKFNIRSNLIVRYLLPIGYVVLVLAVSTFHFIFTFRIYLSLEEKLYSFLGFVIINIFWLIFSHLCFAIVWVGFTIWYIATVYLKYKFREITAKIEISLKYSDINLLMNAIKEHNYVEILTKRLNLWFRMITFIIYYIATIGFQLILFIFLHNDSNFWGKLITGFIFLSCFWAVLMMNFMSTGITRSAHKSYPKLYNMITKGIRIRFRQRWKILSFIEKLSGPPIGFYCYDLFPMNSYEFYQYLYIAGSNYFLIMDFFR